MRILTLFKRVGDNNIRYLSWVWWILGVILGLVDWILLSPELAGDKNVRCLKSGMVDFRCWVLLGRLAFTEPELGGRENIRYLSWTWRIFGVKFCCINTNFSNT